MTAVADLLLVGDDGPLRRLLPLALPGAALTWRAAAHPSQAFARLREQRYAMVLVDAALPDAEGPALLTTLSSNAALRGPAELAWLGPPADTALAARLTQYGVKRRLRPPLDAAELIQHLQALRALAGPSGHQPDCDGTVSADAKTAPQAREDDAIARYFAGDVALYRAFRQASLAQFATDLANGHEASQAADLPRLRRLAHNLKAALLSLGQPEAAQLALQLEQAAATHHGAQAQALWPPLANALMRMRSGSP